ncbi:MAG: site-specific integrase [Bacteroidota bacterium]|nr:site-specific integrase [Bacteroidota bacterium]
MVLYEKAFIDYSSLKDKTKPVDLKEKKKAKVKTKINIPQAYYDALDIKRYSESTKKTYINYFIDFAGYFSNKVLEDISVDEINQYILELIRGNNISSSQQNQWINAIKFYYEKVLGREKVYVDIERPRRNLPKPNILSVSEIKQMVDSSSNLKHKCIISLLYSGGLRRSELVNLRISDILSDQMLIKIQRSKGNKDRYVGLSNYLLMLLKDYYKKYRPIEWIIEGQGGGQYSGTSILKVIKASAKRAGINRNVTPHMLRHSFATHHLESGTDLRYIQEFLGHSSPKTTEIYTHVAKTDFIKFRNPLDNMYENSS